MDKKYIYNPTFANWLIVNGCTVIGAGVGMKTKTTYILFENNDKFAQACKMWNPKSKR